MSSTNQSVRIVPLSILPSAMKARVRAGRMEAAKVWSACRDIHLDARTHGTSWPGRSDLQKATKGGFALHSQSVQMVCHAFLVNVDTARQLRQQGRKDIRYPWRDKVFYPLLWPAQAMSFDGGNLVLPMGRGRASLVLPRPEWLTELSACKLVWNGVYDELHVAVEQEHAAVPPGTAKATVDLGQIHLAAVTTDEGHALIVSGRGIRSEKRRMNKLHGSMARKLSKCTKGSRRWKKLCRGRNAHALRIEHRIRDMRHQATRKVVDFCIQHRVGSLFIGNPDGVRRRRCGRKHNQRMSQWEYGKDINYLQHKAAKACIESFTGTERGTSSQCPRCGQKHKPTGRNWRCPRCDFVGHRDIVGSVNMHDLAFGIKVTFPSLKDTTYQRPVLKRKHPGLNSRDVGSCSRPDTGHGVIRVATSEVLAPTSGFAASRKRLDNANTLQLEAHPL